MKEDVDVFMSNPNSFLTLQAYDEEMLAARMFQKIFKMSDEEAQSVLKDLLEK